jgi:hypothetical protein
MGSKLLKPSENKTTSWGNRQVDRIKLAAAFTSREAPWRPGAALASRGAGDALRGAGKLASVANNDWLQSPVHSGGPSFLISRPNRATAHTPICSVRDFLSPRPRTATLDAFEGACGCGACWLLLSHPTNACKCHRGLKGPCIERGSCAFFYYRTVL